MGPIFLTYETSDVLDTQCRQNVSIDLDFAQIQAAHRPLFGRKKHFLGFV